MKALSADSFLARSLAGLTVAVCRHPRWFFWPQAVLFMVCVVYALPRPYGHLDFDMNRDNLVGPDQRYHQNYLRLQKEFTQQDDVVVVVESDNIEKNRQFVERIAAKMQMETNLFRDVFYQQSLVMMGSKALLYASETNLVEMKTMLRAAQPFVRQFTQTTNLVSFFEQINTAFRTAPREANADTKSLIQALPALTRIVTQAIDSLQRPGTPPSPNVIALFDTSGSGVLSNYITFANGRIFLVTTHAPNAKTNGPTVDQQHQRGRQTQDEVNGYVIDRLRQLVKQTQAEVPGLNVGITGMPVLDYDELAQSQKDITLASVVSLVLCALIFIYGYNEIGRPVKATICLVVGLAYTLAFTTLTVGHLNILTITFVPMLIGLAIDFGVHLITRYEEELRHGKTEAAALTKAMVFTGQGIFTGALTTAGAFLAMTLTHFKGIQEMGIICGGGLLICFIPMMTLLPVMLLRGRQNVIDHRATEDDTRARIENIWLQRPLLVMGITAGLCLAAFWEARKVHFDYNLIKMQSPSLPSVVFEHKLLDSADKSLLYGAVMADSLTNAVELREKIKQLPVVADVDPPFYGDFLMDQSKKLELVGQIKQEIASFQFNPADLRPVDIYELSRTLYGLYGYLGNALEEVGNSDPDLTGQLVSLRQAIENLRKVMLQGDAPMVAEHADKLAQFQQALFADLRDTFQLLQHQDDSTPLQVEDLPPALHDRFVGVTGKFLLQIYPNTDVWQRDNQEKFVTALRTVDGNVTGTPVQLYEYETLLKDSYVNAAWYSLAAIALMVLFHFRSLGAVILSLLPVVIGTLWLAGLMGWFSIPINLANIMTLPLVIGIGVTNGIHILNRFAEERTPGILSRSTGKAVLVSGLTAIAGFGSLILAKHRGIYSLGCLMATGIATCMIAGLTFLPALLNLLGRWRPLIKQPSADNSPSTLGQEEPR
ncbi:MAG: MMPL family transporter [Verrucomicrobiota bacterium]|jgi:hopanoid biosynthesis associated RND transporter like protein HpnN